MKINTVLILSIASLTLLFAGCGGSTNTTTNMPGNSNAARTVNSNPTPENTVSAAKPSLSAEDQVRFKGEYMVGDVKCTITPDNNDLIHEIKCADKEKVQIYSRDDAPPKAVIVSQDQKSRFVFDNPANLANGNFTDATGKTVKVSRVQ